jgi:hypothetical protein
MEYEIALVEIVSKSLLQFWFQASHPILEQIFMSDREVNIVLRPYILGRDFWHKMWKRKKKGFSLMKPFLTSKSFKQLNLN